MKQGILLLTVGIMLLTGCSSVPTKDIQIETQVSPQTNFKAYKTYSWLGTAEIVNDPLGQWEPPAFDADTEIKYLIDRELRKRGMSENAANPDLIVAFGVGVKMKAFKFKQDPKTIMLENVPIGGLVVAFLDPSTDFALWAGTATAELMEEPDMKTSKARLDYVVTQMLKDWPE